MKYILILAVLFTFLVSDEDYEEHEREHYYSKDLSYLSLDKEQKTRVKKILKEYQKELKKYIEIKKQIIKEKRNLFLKKRLNKEKIKELGTRLFEFANKIEVNFLNNMHKILNQKQRKKFSRYIYEWEIE